MTYVGIGTINKPLVMLLLVGNKRSSDVNNLRFVTWGPIIPYDINDDEQSDSTFHRRGMKTLNYVI